MNNLREKIKSAKKQQLLHVSKQLLRTMYAVQIFTSFDTYLADKYF